jgi:hypothetical protein
MNPYRQLQILFTGCFMLVSTAIFAGPGDTIKVQTFTFGSPQDAWFEMPAADVDVEKILLKYTLKCNPAQSPACGEWDYLTYTYLYEHTGVLDSTLLTHPNYEANGASPETYAYATTPTYTYVPGWLYGMVYDDTLSYNEFSVGNGSESLAFPLGASAPVSRSQFIWTADELLATGMVSGDISGLQVYLNSAGSALHNVSVRMATTASAAFSGNFESAAWTEVFHSDLTPSGSGWAGLDFTTPFTWDGISNILVEITYENTASGTDSWLRGSAIGANRSIFSASNDRYLDVWNPVYAAVDGNPFSTLNNNITVAYWSYGKPEFQPQSGTTFEVRDADFNRVVNVHGPWGDGVMYWDAGNSGGTYDRINKAATAADYEGNWTHWAFTKDAVAGSMKIYKNGVEWHSGTGKFLDMSTASDMRIGKGMWGGSESFQGWIDEFAMWNEVLDPTIIQDYMYKDLDAAHPNADDLFLYYGFNDGTGIYESDASSSGTNLGLIGAASRLYDPAKLFRNTTMSDMRPDIIWEQGSFTSHIDSVFTLDSVMNDAVTMVLFDPLNPTVGIDTFQVWTGDYYNYLYDINGAIIDSFYVSNTNEIALENYEYYSAPFEVVNRYELARYITPYGIGLDLGDGFTWTFDLSDYRPLLTDSVHLSAGNWQELLDMQIWFIEGTPPRDPISVTNLWTGFKGFNTDEAFDENTPAITMQLPAEAKNFRVKSRVSGHGFGGTANCAEFCKKDHYFKIDGTTVWTEEVWRDDCDVNPVYPQGGTWVYDRANWCPGAEVGTYDFDITEHVVPGNTYTFDYAAEDYLWNGGGSFPYYQTEVQLVTYGAFNFDLDVAVMDIIAPTTDNMWSRKNPICSNPIIRIQNTGAQTLTSLVIQFGMKDTEKSTFNWTGELAPMQWEEIALPDYIWNVTGEFEVSISEPNGGTDEYANNNVMTSKVTVPATQPNKLILEFKTNTKPSENDVFVYNSNGEEVFARTSFTASTIHKDTLDLPDGCYELYVWDYGEDGISWWANSDGTGYFRLKDGNTSATIKNYEPDFGGLIYEQFTVGTYVEVNEAFISAGNNVQLYPNPAQNEVYLHIALADKQETDIMIFNYAGQLVHSEQAGSVSNTTLKLDIAQLPAGMYVAVVKAGDEYMKLPFIRE